VSGAPPEGDASSAKVQAPAGVGPSRAAALPGASKKRRKGVGGARSEGGVGRAGGANSRGVRDEAVMQLDSIDNICDSIMVGLNKGHRHAHPPSVELDIEYTLSTVPYRDMLHDLVGNTDSFKSPRVPIVRRAYEESYMREVCKVGERACVMGTECECMSIDRLNPFRGVEFVLPGESEHADPQMCVLCHRRFVQALFHDVIYTGMKFHGVVQRYGSICGKEGEYATEVMLICPPGG
jgi:hypothetical protein